MTMTRNDALKEIARLANNHAIGLDEIGAHLMTLQAPSHQKNLISQMMVYIGGIFVFAGIGLLINFLWADIGSAQRVILTFGTGVGAFILAIAALRDIRYEKGTTPLFALAALLQPTGLFIFLHEYVPGHSNPVFAAMLVFGVMAAQHGLAFKALNRTSLLFFMLVFWNGFIVAVLNQLHIHGSLPGIAIGISMLSLAYGVSRTTHRGLTPFWYFVGAISLLGCWWDYTHGGPFDLSYLGVNAFLIYISVLFASRTLLFVSVLGLLSYLSYFAWKYFAHMVGWPICLILLGLLMMGLSAYAIKLGQRMRGQ